jgi:hypothetical protein
VDLQGSTATFIFDDPEQRADSVMREFYNGGQVAAAELWEEMQPFYDERAKK